MSTTAPTAICTCCQHVFHVDDYYDMSEGSEVQCPKCEAEFVVTETEMVMHWSFSTKAEYDAREAKVKEFHDRQREEFMRQVAERKKP